MFRQAIYPSTGGTTTEGLLTASNITPLLVDLEKPGEGMSNQGLPPIEDQEGCVLSCA